jgi:hypothetical protein
VDTAFAYEQLLCLRDGFPIDERVTMIQEEFMPRATLIARQMNDAERESKLAELTSTLREQVFGYFPQNSGAPAPEWGEELELWGRRVRKVSFEGWDGIKISGWYSLPAHMDDNARLPGVIAINSGDSFGWDPPLVGPEGYNWGERAVLVVDLLDSQTRTIDDSLAHQMRRQATIIGRSFDEMRVYELLRSVRLLRSMPEVDPSSVTITGRGALGVDGLYGALLAGGPPVKAVLESPTASHTEGPYFLGILRETDIPEVIALMGSRVKVVGETPSAVSDFMRESRRTDSWRVRSLAEALD